MNTQALFSNRKLALGSTLLALVLTGCDDNNSGAVASAGVTGSKAAIAMRAADYGSARIDLHDVANGDLLLSYPAAPISDIAAATDGTSVYQIGRLGIDNLTKFVGDTNEVSYQYSVNGEETGANPYQIAFVSDQKAYVLRYGSDKIWIINPSADSEAGFKLGELDVSAYDTQGAPEVGGGAVVGDKLFVMMERLDGWDVVKQGYVAVFDTNTDTEIDTGQGTEDGLLGIATGVQNPEYLRYSDANGFLYLTGRGNAYGAEGGADRFTGGVVSIDTASYEATLLLDDGTEAENQGFLQKAVITGADAGYVLSNTGGYSGLSTLRRFNPITSALQAGTIAELEALDITTLAHAPDNQLWVGVNKTETVGTETVSMPYVQRVELTDDSAGDSFDTALVPMNIVFVE